MFDNKNPFIVVTIPHSAMSDRNLKLHFTINHPGISKKYENGRDLGIFMQSLKIESHD